MDGLEGVQKEFVLLVCSWMCLLCFMDVTFDLCVQDKKWILNHEDVALGELLGKVTLPSLSSCYPWPQLIFTHHNF